ncbi:MAG: hypothetical protein ABR541_03115, partial [Candidatus Dormibacteria bacterium]
NTVIVIEHNLDVLKTADHLIDLGPGGGTGGGAIVALGTPEQVSREPESATGEYLRPLLSGRAPSAAARPTRAAPNRRGRPAGNGGSLGHPGSRGDRGSPVKNGVNGATGNGATGNVAAGHGDPGEGASRSGVVAPGHAVSGSVMGRPAARRGRRPAPV